MSKFQMISKITVGLFLFVHSAQAAFWNDTPEEIAAQTCRDRYGSALSTVAEEYINTVTTLETLSESTYCSAVVNISWNEKRCKTSAKTSSYTGAAAFAAAGCGWGLLAAPLTLGSSIVVGCGGGLLVGGLSAASTAQNSEFNQADMNSWSALRKARFDELKNKLKSVESRLMSTNNVFNCIRMDGLSETNNPYWKLKSRTRPGKEIEISRFCPKDEIYQYYLNNTQMDDVLEMYHFSGHLMRLRQMAENKDVNYCKTEKLLNFDEYLKNLMLKIEAKK